MNESEFIRENPDAQRLPEMDSLTARAYATENYLWLFDKCDGHLAWQYDRNTRTTVFECDCMKRGREILGI